MKKGLVILLIVIILIVIVSFVITNNNSSKQLDGTNIVSNNLENVAESSTQNSVQSNEVSNETEVEYENDGTFAVSEIEESDYNSYFTVIETDAEYEESFDIVNNGDELTITFYDTQLNEYLIGNSNAIEYDTEYTVVNSGNVDTIFVGEEGQDWNYPLALLLQTDGTVKAIDMRVGYLTGEFIAKNITELENIERFEQVSISYPDDSGYNGVVAISEDGKIYEISGYIVE